MTDLTTRIEAAQADEARGLSPMELILQRQDKVNVLRPAPLSKRKDCKP